MNIPDNLTTEFSTSSFTRLLNMLSPFVGSGKQYVPQWAVKMFSGAPGSQWNRSGAPARLAHLTTKTVLGVGTAASLVYLARALAHGMKVDAIDNVNPAVTAGGKLPQGLNIPEDRMLTYMKSDQKKKKSKNPQGPAVQKMAALSPYNVAVGTLPLGASLLAMIASMAAADKHFDQKLSKQMDKGIEKQQKQSDKIAKRRILATRAPQMIKQQNLKKESQNLFDTAESAAGLLAIALASAGFIGGFNWQRSNSKNTIKYKAYKKGLQEYNRSRMDEQNVDSRPIDPKLLQLFNSGLKNKQNKVPVTRDPMREVLV